MRRVVNARLDPRYVPMLTRDLEQQAESFEDSADDALNDPGKTVTGKDADVASLGVALYVFETAPVEGESELPKTARGGNGRRTRTRSRKSSRSTRR